MFLLIHKKSSEGFTFIELIVVISVIAILSIVGIASFVNYNRLQTVNSAANNLATMLSLAKSRASNQVKPSQCASVPTCVLNGYQVVILSSTSYELDAVSSIGKYPASTVNLPPNVSITNPIQLPTTIFFNVITGGVSPSSGITISVTGYGYTSNITVDPSGNIR